MDTTKELVLQVRLSSVDKAKLVTLANESSMSLSGYIRFLIQSNYDSKVLLKAALNETSKLSKEKITDLILYCAKELEKSD